MWQVWWTRTVDASSVAVHELRGPRTVLALVAGAALGLAGALMQSLTRNPLADPGLLGVNAGAALCVVLAVALVGVHLGRLLPVVRLPRRASSPRSWSTLLGDTGGTGGSPARLALAGVAR